MRSVIRRYFSYSKRETNGLLILIPLMVVIILVSSIYKRSLTASKTLSKDNAFTQLLVDEIKSITHQKSTPQPDQFKSTIKLIPVRFDPNKASTAQLELMGLSKKLVQTINNYRLKGGVFRIKNDLAKIYGLDKESFDKLYDYIDLPENLPSRAIAIKNQKRKYNDLPIPVIKDINTATREDFAAIRGIGEVLSQRIVSFRSGLGGFHSMDQLNEIYGLKDTVIMRLNEHFTFLDSLQLNRLDLITSSEKELSKHPYIDYKLARVIVAFRDQHKIQSKTQLLEIKVMTDSLYRKLSPYIYVSDNLNKKGG